MRPSNHPSGLPSSVTVEAADARSPLPCCPKFSPRRRCEQCRRNCSSASSRATTRPSIKLNDTQAIIATTDFFTPIVDDPYDFGRIAATNALSDIYAMGGQPILALAIVGMPIDKLPVEVIQRIISGGESVCAAAGIPVAGGHSIDTLEPIYGLVALGIVHPDKVKRNDRARAGDALILGSRSASASSPPPSRKGSSRRRVTPR